MDFKAYLASSSEENSESDVEVSRQKLRNLLNEAVSHDQSDVEQEMEITFTPGLREITEETSENKPVENETTIEAYKRKQLERKKKKKATRKLNSINEGKTEDININFDDPFFSSSRSNKSKGVHKMSQQDRMEMNRKKAELELLVAGDEDDHERRHFDMKEIIKNEKKKGRKKKLDKGAQNDNDSFEINTDDSRFAALYNSHHFAIDPTNSHFKKTKAMSRLLEEQRFDMNGKDKRNITEKNEVLSFS
ncbi:4622_t:CDS:2 [Acaulospora colombiana]|uniref:4622_t:CDS:1 n=1 Tax=Acaulospora colombiana TaxID=27376 RepID=A0ACA9M6E3_9GLOM|nr:4622_t:CDS:2 [Acaulospora colombiana]